MSGLFVVFMVSSLSCSVFFCPSLASRHRGHTLVDPEAQTFAEICSPPCFFCRATHVVWPSVSPSDTDRSGERSPHFPLGFIDLKAQGYPRPNSRRQVVPGLSADHDARAQPVDVPVIFPRRTQAKTTHFEQHVRSHREAQRSKRSPVAGRRRSPKRGNPKVAKLGGVARIPVAGDGHARIDTVTYNHCIEESVALNHPRRLRRERALKLRAAAGGLTLLLKGGG